MLIKSNHTYVLKARCKKLNNKLYYKKIIKMLTGITNYKKHINTFIGGLHHITMLQSGLNTTAL